MARRAHHRGHRGAQREDKEGARSRRRRTATRNPMYPRVASRTVTAFFRCSWGSMTPPLAPTEGLSSLLRSGSTRLTGFRRRPSATPPYQSTASRSTSLALGQSASQNNAEKNRQNLAILGRRRRTENGDRRSRRRRGQISPNNEQPAAARTGPDDPPLASFRSTPAAAADPLGSAPDRRDAPPRTRGPYATPL